MEGLYLLAVFFSIIAIMMVISRTGKSQQQIDALCKTKLLDFAAH